ncbi:lysophospholipid acyltransferase family protein [Helcococcus kunzii]|uniref:lysophospholipid acyltransferase family protein n=1 Tax=Helcococcus kunzii TaxID=40091 RepID=UPI0024AD48A9|nr:lysophospholipid acyltransferase family protein [Helcococcus kunzii]
MLYNIAKIILYPIFKLIYLFRVKNKPANIPTKNLIICANHKSNLDPLMVALVVDEKVNFMAKKELFKNIFFAALLRKLYAFPVDRGNSDIESIRTAMFRLKEGKILGIFPEGTRIKRPEDIKRENFNDGIAMIATRTNSDILPLEIKGDYKLFGKVEIVYKDIIKIEDFKSISNKKEQYEKIIDEIYNRIYNS